MMKYKVKLRIKKLEKDISKQKESLDKVKKKAELLLVEINGNQQKFNEYTNQAGLLNSNINSKNGGLIELMKLLDK